MYFSDYICINDVSNTFGELVSINWENPAYSACVFSGLPIEPALFTIIRKTGQ